MIMIKNLIPAIAAILLTAGCSITIGDPVDNTMILNGITYHYVLPLHQGLNDPSGYVTIDINHPASESIHGHGGFSYQAVGRTIDAGDPAEADRALLMDFNFSGPGSYTMALVSGVQTVRREGNTLIVYIDGKDINGQRFYLNAYVYDEVEFWNAHPAGIDARWEPGM